jgi:CHAT domain-containing protein/Tfp pilus assembly protein PilF
MSALALKTRRPRPRWALRLLLGLSLTLLSAPLLAQPRRPPAAKPAPAKPSPAAPPAAPQALTAAQQAADAEGLKLVRQAGDLQRQKRFAEAIEIAKSALAIREKALGPDHLSVIVTVKFLAELHEGKRDFKGALPLRERALAATEKDKGPNSFETAVALGDVARVCSRSSDHARALLLLERALSIHVSRRGPGDMMSTIVLSEIGSVLLAKRDFDAAEASLTKLLRLYEAEHDHPTDAVIAQTLARLAKVHVAKHRFAEAEGALLRTLRLRVREGHESLIINALVDLGRLYEEMGFYGRAEPYFERARSIMEREVAPNSPEIAIFLDYLANVAAELGDYARAEGLYLRALSLQSSLDQESLEVAVSKLGLGELHTAMGDLNGAEPLLTAALAIVEKKLQPSDPNVAIALSALADLRSKKGDADGATALLNRALIIDAAILGPNDPKIAMYQTRLARIEQARGKLDAAEQLFRRALALREKVLGGAHPAVADSLLEVSAIRRLRGDVGAAEPLYQRALAIDEKALGRDHLRVASALSGLAALDVARGNVAAAVARQARAADIEEHNLGLILEVGSEAQKRSFMATLADSTDFTVSLHASAAPKDAAAQRLALTTILQRKGRVLDVMADALSVLRRRLPEADQPLLLQLAAARAAFAGAALRGPGDAPLEMHRDSLKHLSEEVQQIEAKMSARSAAFWDQETPVTIERVQAALPEDAALVEYFVYHPTNQPSKAGAPPASPPRLAAYTLRPSGQVRFVDLGPVAAVDAAVTRLRKVLSSTTEGAVKEPSRALDDLVMRPVRALLDGAARVLLSPDGALNVIPFGALIDEQGRFLIERFDFTYLTSGRDLLRRTLRSPARSGPLVFANPAFGRAGMPGTTSAPAPGARRSASLADAFFPPLPGTASEARALSKILRDAELMVDVEATESALKKTSAPRILHVATHGFFLPDQKPTEASGDVPARSLTVADGQASAAVENPLLRSGLALAGANGRKSGSEDGILTALEAAGLDLDGTDLVVLSACETGLGDVQNGDGVYGLRRALFIAGAATEVTSLWKVDDLATRDLMVSYYQKLERGGGRSASLHDVQRAMLGRRATAHPYYWASFVVSGDPSPLEPKALSTAPKTAPSARGCACEVGGAGGSAAEGGWVLLFSLALARPLFRRRSRPLSARRINRDRR